MPQAQYARSGKFWYVGDGLIWDSHSANYQWPDMPAECSGKLFVYNPQRHAAGVTARFFHTDRPPTQIKLSVKPGEVECLELAALSEIPHGQAFWIAVEADTPVLPQACHEDFFQWDPVPDALISPTPYPGPLEDETTWIAADCLNLMPRKGWYEFETLTILNPGKQAAKVRLTYSPMKGGVAEESIELAAERVAQINAWQRFPVLQGAETGPQVAVLWNNAMRIDATSPVIAQSTRRAPGQPALRDTGRQHHHELLPHAFGPSMEPTLHVYTGVRTPLWAKAVVLSDGEASLAVATLDAYGLQPKAAEQARQLAGQQAGLPPEAIMLVCSGTRAAPCTTPVVGGPEVDEGYVDQVVQKVAQVVVEAKQALQPASLGSHLARLPHLAYNHRLLTRNQKAVTAWLGVPKDEVLAPEGPIDPDLGLLVVRDGRGFPLALLWSFAADNRFSTDEASPPTFPTW